MAERIETDAVVLGAGTAGANAALQLASRGLRVVLLERRELSAGGAQWHNAVLEWQFRRAGLEPPGETAGTAVTHMFGPGGEHGVSLPDPPTVKADMVALGHRLRSLAAEAGVEMFERCKAVRVELDGVRPVALRTEATPVSGGRSDEPPEAASRRMDLRAPLFVDASGLHGALRRQVPSLHHWCPPVRGNELCTATDQTHEVRDPDGALRFLRDHGARPGDGVSILGTNGGFSTRGLTVSSDLTTVSVLVGCLANGRHGTGPAMLAELLEDQPWIGDAIDGGSGVIPLRRTYARISAPGVALVGDSACQVFPAHGSGIGMGLMAGTMLAEAVQGAGDPGAEEVLWDYQYSWHRDFGGALAAFDGFRRMSTALGSAGVAELMGAGLMSEQMARTGLDQLWATPPPGDLPRMAARLARHPRLAARMLPMMARGQVAGRLAGSYPETVDLRALQRWDRRMSAVLGPLPG